MNAEVQTGVDVLDSGMAHSCGAKDGYVTCWGSDTHGQLRVHEEFKKWGRGKKEMEGYVRKCQYRNTSNDNGSRDADAGDDNINVNVNINNRYRDCKVDRTSLALGLHHSCASNQSTLKCWGSINKDVISIPKQFANGVSHLTSGLNHLCANKRDVGNQSGLTQCWGVQNYSEQVTYQLFS